MSIASSTPRPRKVFAGVLVATQDNILLGLKKRGFGTGLWQHSFAGKVESGETVAETAIRELGEETGLIVTKDQIKPLGVFEYQFSDTNFLPWLMEVHIYRAIEWTGEPRECEEIAPRWFQFSEVPYHSMWADNSYWLNRVLVNRAAVLRRAFFLYDHPNTVINHELEFEE